MAYKHRAEYLTKGGFLDFEVREFARQYSMNDLHSIPYLVNIRRWRVLYVAAQRKRGYSDVTIRDMINRLYGRSGWKSPWDMLRHFRKRAIDSGDYLPPKKHKTKGAVSQDALAGQRRTRRSLLERYDEGRGR